MRSRFSELAVAWDRFWFYDVARDHLRLALFRASFGAVMAFYFYTRQDLIGFFYTDAGILARADLWRMESMRYSPTLLSLTDNLQMISALNLALVGFCITLALGIFPRVSALLCYVLALSFFHRDMWGGFGVDFISIFYFLYLGFTPSGERLSFGKSLFRGRSVTASPESWHGLLASVSYRLMQMQLCAIYVYSGWKKLRGSTWWRGEALANALSIHYFQNWNLHFLSTVPMLLVVLSFAVVLYEVYFPFLLMSRRDRRLVLSFGIAFHLGIFFLLNLPSFGLMMTSLYFLFWPREDFDRVFKTNNNHAF